MKFLVTIGDSTRPICCEDPVSMLNLQLVTRQRFGLGSEVLKFKYWDEEWSEYVDLEDCSMLQDRTKLKVILVRNSQNAFPLQVPSEPLPSTSRASAHLSHAEDILEFEDFSQDQGSSSTHTSKPAWPDDFSISEETLPSQLREALEKQVDLTKPSSRYLRGLLLSAVIDEALTYTSYPDKLQKLQMARAIVHQWPHLRSRWGGPTDGWMACIIDKLKNRRRGGQHEPSTGRGRGGEGQPKPTRGTKRRREAQSFLNTEPQAFGEEDKPAESAVTEMKEEMEGERERMIAEMKEEMEKMEGERDGNKLKRLFLSTFPHRRELLSRKASVERVMEEYPFLFTREGFALDFQLLTNSTNTLREFRANASLKASRIVDLGRAQVEKLSRSASPRSAERRARLQRSLEMMDVAMETLWCLETETEPSRQAAYHQTAAAMTMLPQLLGEEDGLFLQEFPESSSLAEVTAGPVTPYVASVGSVHSSSLFYLVLSNTVVMALGDALDAMATLAFSYYVFGLPYPKHCECTLKFLQVQILQRPDEENTKIPPKLLNFMNTVE